MLYVTDNFLKENLFSMVSSQFELVLFSCIISNYNFQFGIMISTTVPREGFPSIFMSKCMFYHVLSFITSHVIQTLCITYKRSIESSLVQIIKTGKLKATEASSYDA